MVFELQAAVPAVPSWVGPTIGISTSLIAVAFIVIAIVALMTARTLVKAFRSMADTIERLEVEAIPALQAVRELSEDGREITAALGQETKALVRTSKRIRKKARRGAERLQERLEDIDALYEVVYDEVEDTALGVAATLRTAKRARGMLSPLSRLWRRRRR